MSIAHGAESEPASTATPSRSAVRNGIGPSLKQLLYPTLKCYMDGVRLARPRTGKGREAGWYFLIHQLPPEPLYLRAKIRQRLAKVGAVALKNAVYVLPRQPECREDFEWIAEEAVAGGGEAFVCEGKFLRSRTDAALFERFRSERSADYEALAETIEGPSAPTDEAPAPRLARARKRFEEIARIDFFDAPARRRTERLLNGLEATTREDVRKKRRHEDLTGRVWATRPGVHVDRIASAWLIRRFVDAKARLRFVDPKSPRGPRELRFDMVGGDFTHEADRCTFETLLARIGLKEAGLAEIAEIVHDIDLKDAKFARPEAPGVERLLTGLVLANPSDEDRIARGLVLFDELYQSFRKKSPVPAKEVSK